MPAPVFGSYAEVEDYGATGLAVPRPASLVSGQGLLVFLTKESNAAVTPPAGWAELGSGAFTSVAPAPDSVPLGLHCFWKRAGGSEATTYSFNWTGGAYARGVALRFSGVASTGSFVDGYDSDQKSTSTDGTTPNVSLTTTGPNRLLVWAGANLYGGTWTPPSGMTEQYDSGATICVATVAQASAGGSGNKSGECSSDMYTCGFLVALSDTPIGGGGGPTFNAGLLPILL